MLLKKVEIGSQSANEIYSLLKSSGVLLTQLALYLTDKGIAQNEQLTEVENNFRKECINLSAALTKQVVKYGQTNGR